MNTTKKNARNSVQNMIVALLLLCGVIFSFVHFYRSNVTRITDQDETYIADIAVQRSELVDDLFKENLEYIRASALWVETAFQNEGVDAGRLNAETEEMIDPAETEKVGRILRDSEDRFVFNHLRFIDLYGRDYTTGEKVIAANVADRPYFKEGVQGKTGITYILDSKVTSERQIGFYSPVYRNGSIAGFVIGFYGEEYINDLIETSVFNHDCEVMLCAQDGTIIYSTVSSIRATNFLEELSAFHFADAADEQNVRNAFSRRENMTFADIVNGQKTVGVVSYVGPDSDFFLVLNFPPEANQSMIRNAGMNGAVLVLSLIGMFLAAGIFFIVRFFVQKKKLLQETKNSNDIHFAMSRLFENFVIVDAATRTYYYIEGMPDIGHIPNEGAYDLFADDLLDRFPDEKERAEAAETISFKNLTERMNRGENIISCNLHAPIRSEEWFTYNFIVVSRDGGGKVTEFIIARQDITGLEKKEEETRRILEQAKDDAEKGNRAKTDFLSSMSHDIRTPMNAIIGYTNIAANHLEDRGMVEESLKKISDSSHYLLSLINDVLDMSKIESGKIQIKENPCDLVTVFERIENLVRSQADRKNLQVSFSTDRLRHRHVVADELRLEQVLINIAGNAVKYTPEGGSVRVEADETEELPDGRSRYRFTVRDTGIGMSEEYLPHVFESFSRETNSTINKIQGTGLGMAITSKLVELMGGEISVASRLGEGSEFTVTVTLPYGTAHEDGENGNAKEASVDMNALAGRKILLVEDNDINAEIAMIVLSEFGLSVDRACDGREGVEKVAGHGGGYYDAVLMDIQMPVLNGYEATKRIRSLGSEYAKKLPIIAMSANAYEEDVRESLSSGMNGHIAKPFDPQALAAVLCEKILARGNPAE